MSAIKRQLLKNPIKSQYRLQSSLETTKAKTQDGKTSSKPNTLRELEYELFPHSLLRVNPPFLKKRLPRSTVDPWAKREEWRYHDFFSPEERSKAAFPGIGIAAGILAVYITYDQWYHRAGPGKVEKEKWDKWMEEREERLGHHGHH